MKRRIRRRDGSRITDREARGLARLAELNAAIARHPAGKQREAGEVQ